MKYYTVTIRVDAGTCPLTGKSLPADSQTMLMFAEDAGKAKSRAMAKTTVKPHGREVKFEVL